MTVKERIIDLLLKRYESHISTNGTTVKPIFVYEVDIKNDKWASTFREDGYEISARSFSAPTADCRYYIVAYNWNKII